MDEKNPLDDLLNGEAQSFMDKEFFENILKQYLGDDEVKVIEFNISAASKPGENYASSLYRAKLTFSSTKVSCVDPLSLIIKTMCEEGSLKANLIDSKPMFDIEMRMYSEILPQFQAIWESAKDHTMMFPKLIYQSKSPRHVIVLEDISEKGYGLIKFPSEDYEVSKMIGKKLAKFHAASYFLAKEKNVDFSDFNLNVYDLTKNTFASILEDTTKACAEELKKWAGYEKYAEKLEVFAGNYFERIINCYVKNLTDGGYNVLNHSDHHIKNNLFKIVDGKIEDVCFIDHQLEFYGSPAVDLIYSLCYDLSAENRKKYRDDYIRYYHEEFVKALKSYGFSKNIPTLTDLHIELLKAGPLEVMTTIIQSVFMYVDGSKMTAEDLDMAEGSKRFRRRCAANPEFSKLLRQEVPRYFYKWFI